MNFIQTDQLLFITLYQLKKSNITRIKKEKLLVILNELRKNISTMLIYNDELINATLNMYSDIIGINKNNELFLKKDTNADVDSLFLDGIPINIKELLNKTIDNIIEEKFILKDINFLVSSIILSMNKKFTYLDVVNATTNIVGFNSDNIETHIKDALIRLREDGFLDILGSKYWVTH